MNRLAAIAVVCAACSSSPPPCVRVLPSSDPVQRALAHDEQGPVIALSDGTIVWTGICRDEPTRSFGELAPSATAPTNVAIPDLPSNTEIVAQLDPASGTTLWAYAAPQTLYAQVTTFGDTVVLAAEAVTSVKLTVVDASGIERVDTVATVQPDVAGYIGVGPTTAASDTAVLVPIGAGRNGVPTEIDVGGHPYTGASFVFEIAW